MLWDVWLPDHLADVTRFVEVLENSMFVSLLKDKLSDIENV